MFDAYIYLETANTMISRDGPFLVLMRLQYPALLNEYRNTNEVVTEWTYIGTEGRTMFVVKTKIWPLVDRQSKDVSVW